MTPTPSPSKTCRKCGQEKPETDFGTDARTGDGLSRCCLACDRRRTGARRGVRHAPSIAELYSVLEAVLPFAELEVYCLADWVQTFPDDLNHAEDAEQARRGKKAIASARRLIAYKTRNTTTRENDPPQQLGERAGMIPAPITLPEGDTPRRRRP